MRSGIDARIVTVRERTNSVIESLPIHPKASTANVTKKMRIGSSRSMSFGRIQEGEEMEFRHLTISLPSAPALFAPGSHLETMATSELQHAIDEWLRLDKVSRKVYKRIKNFLIDNPKTTQDPETLSEIQTLVTSQDYTELHNRLSTRITFGTAGLRARMQAGNAYMNSLTVIQATQGLAQYALKVQGERVKEMGAVIGHDHRFRSKRFAESAAGVFRSAGVKVYLLEGLSHTPMIVSLSFLPAHENGLAYISLFAAFLSVTSRCCCWNSNYRFS